MSQDSDLGPFPFLPICTFKVIPSRLSALNTIYILTTPRYVSLAQTFPGLYALQATSTTCISTSVWLNLKTCSSFPHLMQSSPVFSLILSFISFLFLQQILFKIFANYFEACSQRQKWSYSPSTRSPSHERMQQPKEYDSKEIPQTIKQKRITWRRDQRLNNGLNKAIT